MLITCLLARPRVEEGVVEEVVEEAEEEATSAVAQAAAPPRLPPQPWASQARPTSSLRARPPRLLPASVAVAIIATVEMEEEEEASVDSRAPVFVLGVTCAPWLLSLFLDLLLVGFSLLNFPRESNEINISFRPLRGGCLMPKSLIHSFRGLSIRVAFLVEDLCSMMIVSNLNYHQPMLWHFSSRCAVTLAS